MLRKRLPENHQVWTTLPFHVLEQVRAFFSVAVISVIGDGANTLFLDRSVAQWTVHC